MIGAVVLLAGTCLWAAVGTVLVPPRALAVAVAVAADRADSRGGTDGGFAADSLRVRVEILAPESMPPGGTALVGLRFQIEAGWHIYWNGRNDTGFPPGLELRLPEGWTAGELQWPAPERYISPGEILDHVYKGEVVLPFDLTAPASAREGDVAALSGAVDWLVCREMCIPESDSVAARIRVATGPSEGPADALHAKAFAVARARLPQPLPTGDPPARSRWDGSTLVLEAPGARALAFFPFSGTELSRPIEDAAAEGQTLRLRVVLERRPPAGDAASDAAADAAADAATGAAKAHAAAAVSGVLEIQPRDGGLPQFYQIAVPHPAGGFGAADIP